ncbi:hypothetical protein IT575_09455 [bacterium]|nr:hypothetical protein [bacterium]
MEQASTQMQLIEELFERRSYRDLKGRIAEALQSEPEGSAGSARLLYMLGCIHEHELNLEEALSTQLAAEQAYLELGLEREALRSRIGITLARRAGNSLETLLQEAQRCAQKAAENGWHTEEAEALLLLANVCRHRDQFEQMLELSSRALSLLDKGRDRYHYYRAASLRAWALSSLGRGEEGAQQAHEAFHLLQGLDNSGLLRRELGVFAYQAWLQRDIARARELTEQQLESAQIDGSGLEAAMSRYNLGLFAAEEEDWETAHKLALIAWQQRLAPQGLALESAVLRLLCLCCLHLGRAEEALNYIDIAVRQLRDPSSDEARLCGYYLALAQAAAGRMDEAAASWQERGELAMCGENRIETRWLLRALEQLWPEAAQGGPAALLAAEMRSNLHAWQAMAQAG